MHKVGTLAVATAMVLAAQATAAQECCGDCNGDGAVTVDEILTTVNFALGGCPAECVAEGDRGAVVPGAPPCCESLVKIGCDAPDPEDNCDLLCVGAFVCARCGDGACGPGENKCNCPTDCVRFVDNGDGTISDNRTGLMWEKKSDDGSIHDWEDSYTWSSGAPFDPDGTVFTEFLATLNDTAFAGHSDWRLPTIEELQDLVDYERNDPAIDMVFHSNCEPGCTVTTCGCTLSANYWSSTNFLSNPNNALTVIFRNGLVAFNFKSGGHSVRAVRGGL
jgi:hypothetical protein